MRSSKRSISHKLFTIPHSGQNSGFNVYEISLNSLHVVFVKGEGVIIQTDTAVVLYIFQIPSAITKVRRKY